MEHIAVFPGSFDPFTIGHEAIVRRALTLFDTIIIAIGTNTNKADFFPIEKRMKWIKEVFEYDEKVSVSNYSGLTVDFCKQVGASFIIRGLRTSSDFEYERAIAQVNKVMEYEVETIFMLTSPEHSAITSTLVRDIIRHGGDASKFLPNSKDLKNLRIH
jgi:pantetheine-phosphate adenylyltransferase